MLIIRTTWIGGKKASLSPPVWTASRHSSATSNAADALLCHWSYCHFLAVRKKANRTEMHHTRSRIGSHGSLAQWLSSSMRPAYTCLPIELLWHKQRAAFAVVALAASLISVHKCVFALSIACHSVASVCRAFIEHFFVMHPLNCGPYAYNFQYLFIWRRMINEFWYNVADCVGWSATYRPKNKTKTNENKPKHIHGYHSNEQSIHEHHACANGLIEFRPMFCICFWAVCVWFVGCVGEHSTSCQIDRNSVYGWVSSRGDGSGARCLASRQCVCVSVFFPRFRHQN